jgi:hypothetical protein
MKKILLISSTPIINQIFTLVSKKLDFNLKVSTTNIDDENFDIIIADETISIQTPENCIKFGKIVKDESLSTDGQFLIKKPFLPLTLTHILQDELLKENQENITSTTEVDDNTIEETVTTDEEEDALDFIQTLADDISDEIIEESDESIIPSAFIEKGGILDHEELSSLQNIINDNTTPIDGNLSDSEDDEWLDLSDIIDKAIDEVKEYNFKSNEPIKLILNDYSMGELTPLLNKLDQNIIDALTNGEEISIKLKMENNGK